MIPNETHAERIERVGKEVAEKQYLAEILDDRADRIFELIFLQSEGSIPERKATANQDEEYLKALRKAREAKRDLNIKKAELKGAEASFEEWRTIQANERSARNAA